MANNKNLKPFTSDTAKENGRKGGIASGVSRNRNKDFIRLLVKVGHQQVDDEEAKRELAKMGLDTDFRNFILLKMIQQVKDGNYKAIQKLFDTFLVADVNGQGFDYIYDVNGNYNDN